MYKTLTDNGITRYSDELQEIEVSSTVGDRNLANCSSLETFSHDSDGNMTSRTKAGETIAYTWSEHDRLLRVSSNVNGRMQDNRYDVNGIRKRKLAKNGNSSTEYTAGISTVASKAGSSGSSAPTISYIRGPMLLGAEVNGAFQFWLSDGISSTRDVIDDTGTVIRSMEFSEYGDLLSSSGAGTVSPKTWVGGLSVNDDTADSGLYLMGHRHYAGGHIGRFVSRDPIGFAGAFNLYEYAASSPITYVDYEGRGWPWRASSKAGLTPRRGKS